MPSLNEILRAVFQKTGDIRLCIALAAAIQVGQARWTQEDTESYGEVFAAIVKAFYIEE